MKKENVFLISRYLGTLSSVVVFTSLTAFTPVASANMIDLSAIKKFFGVGKTKAVVTETAAPVSTSAPAVSAEKPAAPAGKSQEPVKKPEPVAKTPAPAAKKKEAEKKPAAKAPASKPAAPPAKAQAPAKKPEPAAKPVVSAKPEKTVSGLPTGATAADFSYRGTLVSSIYFNAVIRDEGNDCGKEAMSSIRNDDGAELMRVCSKTVKTCLMEGVCQVLRKKESRVFNYHGTVKGRPAFFELKNGDCVFGFGVSAGGCLDPFYTLAADLKHHKAGEVIYIPQIVGTVLPGGEKHSGFFIVRDTGGGIKGVNRFDFFTGPIDWKSGSNPFFQINLSNSKNKFTYYRVTGATAERFKDQRNFPKLPDDQMFEAFKDLD